DVIEAEAPFDTKPIFVGRTVTTVDIENPVAFDVHLGLAANTAVRTNRVDGFLLERNALARRIEQVGLHQRAGRAGLYALAARNAGRVPHALVEVEHRLGVEAAIGHADDIVHLHLAAGAHAQAALDARVEIDRYRRM